MNDRTLAINLLYPNLFKGNSINFNEFRRLDQSTQKDLFSDKELVLAAVQKSGSALQYASKALKADKEVVLAAVQQNGRAIEYACLTLQEDEEVLNARRKEEPIPF